MPYRRAHWFLAGLFPLIALAFYPQYFRVFSTSSVAFHIHGISAILWILALMLQSWAIHNGRRDLHRSAGKAALAIFPLFFASFFLIMHSMATKYAAGDVFYVRFGAQLGVLDLVAGVAVGAFVYLGVRDRRRTHAHAAWLMGTLIFLLGPIFGRLAGFTPWWPIRGPEDFGNFPPGMHAGNVVAFLVAMTFALAAARGRATFLWAAGISLLTSVLFETLGETATWGALFGSLAQVSPSFLFALGLASGIAIVLTAWFSGMRRGSSRAFAHS